MPIETTPAAAAQTPPAAAPPAAPQTVTIPLDQLQAFMSIQARLADMESAQRSQQEAAQQEQARILADVFESISILDILGSTLHTLAAEWGALVIANPGHSYTKTTGIGGGQTRRQWP